MILKWKIVACVLLYAYYKIRPIDSQPRHNHEKTTATRILVDTAVKIKQTGFSESFGEGFSGVSASHKKNCTAGNH
jgi:hypothetical protein